MTLIDKGSHCGFRVFFATFLQNDGTYNGDIRVLDNPRMTPQLASPMDDTLRLAATEAELIALLETKLAELIEEAR